MKPRTLALLLCTAVVAAGLYLSLGPPRMLWLNTGLRIAYAWTRGAGALAAAAGAAGLAAALRPRAGRVVAGVVAVLLAAFAAERFAYRADVVEDAIAVRTLAGASRLPWTDVTHVESILGAMTVITAGKTLSVPTSSLSAEQRAALERTVARRVREAGTPSTEPASPSPESSPPSR